MSKMNRFRIIQLSTLIKQKSIFFSIVVSFLLSTVHVSYANLNSNLDDYGELFLIEHVIQKSYWAISSGFFLQPESIGQQSYGTEIALSRRLMDQWSVGFLAQKFLSNGTQTNTQPSDINTDLQDLEVKISYLKPTYATYANATYHLFFSRMRPSMQTTWDWVVDLHGLAGFQFYENLSPQDSLGAGVECGLIRDATLGLSLGLRQFFENSFSKTSSAYHLQTHIGVEIRI